MFCIVEISSVIVPCRNVASYISQCMDSILDQDCIGQIKIEVSVFDDCSTDNTVEIVQSYSEKFISRAINFKFSRCNGKSGGVAYAKNRAVQQSTGEFLCFLDADDVAHVSRVRLQYEIMASFNNELAIVGSKFSRIPVESTMRYTKWANGLTPGQLYTQIYTANGPTLVAPTWFLTRRLYDAVGGFNEAISNGYPEDLDFYYRALNLGTKLHRIDKELVIYRFHANCASFSVLEQTIFAIRLSEFETNVLSHWDQFSIWNAGKQGKQFYRTLKHCNQNKVAAFCDVDVNKIKHGYYESYERTNGVCKVGRRIAVISHESVIPPVVICVKLDLTNGQLEMLISEKHWIEGKDYYFFS